jgi:hypothetical protein
VVVVAVLSVELVATTSSTLAMTSTTTTTLGGSTTTTSTLPPAPFVGVRTTSRSLRDRTTPPTPSTRKLSFKSKTKGDPAQNRVIVPAPGGGGDPTVGGATLVVYNAAGSGERVTVTLPAAGWRLIGSGAAPRGYRFSGLGSTDPISRVIVKADQIKVRGGKENWAYTLNEDSQGRIAVRLQLGSGAPWCADAPARSSGSPNANDQVDRFTAQPKTPAPVVCPPVP